MSGGCEARLYGRCFSKSFAPSGYSEVTGVLVIFNLYVSDLLYWKLETDGWDLRFPFRFGHFLFQRSAVQRFKKLERA